MKNLCVVSNGQPAFEILDMVNTYPFKYKILPFFSFRIPKKEIL